MIASTPHQEFLETYQPLHGQFIRYCSSRAYGLIETEDLVQEAILAGLENYERIRNKQQLLGFLIGVANNIIRNKRRRLKFKGHWDEQAFEKLQSRAPSPDIALDLHYLLKAMDQLPEKQKEAILLFEISGFSIREVSEIQQSTESATKTRISRGRQKLKDLLAEDSRSMTLSQRLAIFSSIIF